MIHLVKWYSVYTMRAYAFVSCIISYQTMGIAVLDVMLVGGLEVGIVTTKCLEIYGGKI